MYVREKSYVSVNYINEFHVVVVDSFYGHNQFVRYGQIFLQQL